jgi:8-oxo-dGTP pyrophosphatase MutT (NUDIX family)
MATRIDYLEDPSAPPPNRVVPSANLIATDPAGRVLLIRRTDNGNYALPGGGMDLGESLTDTAIREALEETGWQVEVDGLVGVFTNPGHVLHYTSNDEVRQEFSVVYYGRAIELVAEADSESSEVVWVAPDDLDGVGPMHPTMRYRLDLWRSGQMPHIDRPGEMATYLARAGQPRH